MAGLSGTLNLFGLAGTSASALKEALLWGAIAGSSVLHTASALETIKSGQSSFPDFKSQSTRQQLSGIACQMKSVVFPLLASLPGGSLAYAGISDRTGLKGLGATAALLTVLSETLTFRLLAKLLLESLTDSGHQVIDGFSKKDKKNCTKCVNI